MKPMRNLSPHIVAHIATINVIIPPTHSTADLGGMRILKYINGIITTKVSKAPRIAPKINLRINTVKSVFLFICDLINKA